LDADDFVNRSSQEAKSTTNTSAVQAFDSFEEEDSATAAPASSQGCTNKKGSEQEPLAEVLLLRKPVLKEIEQFKSLMEVNVLDHRLERDKARVDFYQERLTKLRAERKNKANRYGIILKKQPNSKNWNHFYVKIIQASF